MVVQSWGAGDRSPFGIPNRERRRNGDWCEILTQLQEGVCGKRGNGVVTGGQRTLVMRSSSNMEESAVESHQRSALGSTTTPPSS